MHKLWGWILNNYVQFNGIRIFQDAVSLLNLLLGVETQTSTKSTGEHQEVKNHVSQRLQRELTHFFNTLLRCLSHTTDR